ncbi:MAG: winged helix DNA-binding domain-containing protein [Chloroflexi bacterium]|nr:winged helix DNA-binding domain-containing protein [Chloroflexota bacterium]
MSLKISAARLAAYRARTYRTTPRLRLKSKEEAVRFVDERGFVYFWPIKGVTLPSLWAAVVGNRPVADAHDDPGHVTWGWKDSMLGERQWYYAKLLRKKATMVSPSVAPYFYALSQNFGSPEEDYLLQYEQGALTHEAKTVYEALLREGRLDSVALRKAARLADARFNRALDELQADCKILPVGVAQAGAWRYAFIYDLVTRHYPPLPAQARAIGLRGARQKLAELYFRSVGAAQLRDLTTLFGWKAAEATAAVEALAQSGVLRLGLSLDGEAGEWFALAGL